MNRNKIALTLISTIVVAGPACAAASVDPQLRAIEARWAKAVVEHDTAALDTILAPDWTIQGIEGRPTSKRAVLGGIRAGNESTSSMTTHDIHVRVLGDIAIVQGAEDEVSTHRGKDTTGRYTFTDVFQKRGGRWVAIASQPTFMGHRE